MQGLASSVEASSFFTRSEGKKGVSQAAVTIKRASGAASAAQRSPARTPASGPAKSVVASAITGSPKGEKREASPLALSAIGAACPPSRSITWRINGLPLRSRKDLSPPPIRRERPPARITPATCSTYEPSSLAPLRRCRASSSSMAFMSWSYKMRSSPESATKRFPGARSTTGGSWTTNFNLVTFAIARHPLDRDQSLASPFPTSHRRIL